MLFLHIRTIDAKALFLSNKETQTLSSTFTSYTKNFEIIVDFNMIFKSLRNREQSS